MASEAKKTLVIGASENPERYSYKAVQRLTANGHPVIALGRKPGRIGMVNILIQPEAFENIDTISVYLSPANQKSVETYLLDLKPKRIIFNPGAENPEFAQKAMEAGIQCEDACTLVLLSTKAF